MEIHFTPVSENCLEINATVRQKMKDVKIDMEFR